MINDKTKPIEETSGGAITASLYNTQLALQFCGHRDKYVFFPPRLLEASLILWAKYIFYIHTHWHCSRTHNMLNNVKIVS